MPNQADFSFNNTKAPLFLEATIFHINPFIDSSGEK